MSSEEILINVSPAETRVVIIEHGLVQECHIERESKKGKVGNIYQGKVVRVLPGMQAAFIDIGLNKTVFLHSSDIYNPDQEVAQAQVQTQESELVSTPTPIIPMPSIEKLLTVGQLICVQVFKDEMGTKGARVTTKLSLPSRYLVYLPFEEKINIALKITDPLERERLKKILGDQGGKGFIIRTAAEGVEEAVLIAEKKYIETLWQEVALDIKSAKVGSLIYEDCSLMLKSIRDFANTETRSIKIDSLEGFKKLQKFSEKFVPMLFSKIELHIENRPLFELYHAESEIQKALNKKVHLKSGGYLIIDQTEALTTIDINTGGFVGTHNLEETAFKTNVEAATQIARQLRLRNIGGIIVIDFIDMEEEEHKNEVMAELEKSMNLSGGKYKIGSFSPLGLVELTRKRVRESLKQQMCDDCPVCNGTGFVKSIDTICLEIYRELIKAHSDFSASGYLILCHESIANKMLKQDHVLLTSLEQILNCPIQFQIEQRYQPEQYHVVLK